MSKLQKVLYIMYMFAIYQLILSLENLVLNKNDTLVRP